MDSAKLQVQLQRGAKVQRPLWASTGTKNPAYSDVLYVEQLIGGNTVNTVTPETLDAFEAHGEIRSTVDLNLDLAMAQLRQLEALHIDLEAISRELEQEGVQKFADSYDQLLQALRVKIDSVARHYAEG